MEHDRHPLVERLRTGEFPPARHIWTAVVLIVVVAGSVAVVAPFLPPTVDPEQLGGRDLLLAWSVPVLFVAAAIVPVACWYRWLDRSTMRVVHAAGAVPVFHLPVRRWEKGYRAFGVPAQLPAIWTIGAHGWSAWSPDVATPVVELPWSDVHAIETATVWGNWMRRTAWPVVRVTTPRGVLDLRVRTAVGSAGACDDVRDATVAKALRLLRHEHDPDGVHRASPPPRGSALGLPGE